MRTAGFVNPDVTQQVAGRLNGVGLVRDAGDDRERQPHPSGGFRPTGPAAQFAHREIVRAVVTVITVAAFPLVVVQHVAVMGQPFTVVFVVINDVNLAPAVLGEPDRRRVIHAQIPPGRDQQRRVVRDFRNPPLLPGGRQFSGEVRALESGLPATEIFLRKFVFRHHRPGRGQFFGVENVGFIRPIQRCDPVRVRTGFRVQIIEQPASLRRAEEDCPAFSIR